MGIYRVTEALTPMMHEHLNMFTKDLFAGLPPMWDIQHCTNLIVRVTLSNQVAYSMSPEEHEDEGELVCAKLKKERKIPSVNVS